MLKNENTSPNQASPATETLRGYAYTSVKTSKASLADEDQEILDESREAKKKSFAEELQETAAKRSILSSRDDFEDYELSEPENDFDAPFEKEERERDWENTFADLSAQSAMIAGLYKYFEEHTSQSSSLNQAKEHNLNRLTNSFLNTEIILPNEPTIDIDKEKLKISIDFPSLQDLKSLTVQYNPAERSINAEMFTSQELGRLLQNQISDLERNLAKHDIKLEHLRINPAPENSFDEGRRRKRQRQQNQQNDEDEKTLDL